MRDKQARYAWFQEMLTWPEDWNGYTAYKPNPEAIVCATAWLDHIESLLVGDTYPLCDTSEDGSITACPSEQAICCEWWSPYDKKLTVYINADGTIEYLRLCMAALPYSHPLHDFMADGIIVNDKVFLKLWRWLHTPIPTRT